MPASTKEMIVLTGNKPTNEKAKAGSVSRRAGGHPQLPQKKSKNEEWVPYIFACHDPVLFYMGDPKTGFLVDRIHPEGNTEMFVEMYPFGDILKAELV